jgi:carboxypeptidase Q
MISQCPTTCSSNFRSKLRRMNTVSVFAHKTRGALALLLTAASISAFAAEPAARISLPPNVLRTVEVLRAAALADNNGYSIVEDLVTQVGPRLAGSEAEARARDWAVSMLRSQGFAKVRAETFPLAAWLPGTESAQVVGHNAQALSITALGGSPSTAVGGIEAPVLRVASMAEFNALDANLTAGKIIFVDEPMARTGDGSGYGAAVGKRRACAPAAKRKGASACLIRAVGTNTDRFTHQGMGTVGDATTLVPSAALAPPDADVLARLVKQALVPVVVHLDIQASTNAKAESGNVLAEVIGRSAPDQIVLAAAHLDSWTLGHGAVDDGAGVAIITAAARLINELPIKPKRSIRILLAGAEEQGGFGGIAYGKTHGQEQHVIAAESDGGAGKIWRIRTRVAASALPYAQALQRALAPLAIIAGDNLLAKDGGGTDIDPITEQGAAIIALNQDMSRYFDVHHTANDVLAEVDPQALRQNIAAWAIALYLAAEMDWEPRP